MPDVGDDADDGRLLTFDLQPRAERGAVGPVALRERFSHDDHRRSIGAVVRRQSPALDDAHAHHLKEVRAHDSEPGLRLVGRRARRRASDNVEREVRVHPAERQRRGQGGGGDARYRGAAFEQPSQQAPRRLFAAVGSARRRDRGGEEPFVTEAEIDVLQRDEALDEERGGHDERHRERDLGDDQQRPESAGAGRLAAAVSEGWAQVGVRSLGSDPPSRPLGASARQAPGLTQDGREAGHDGGEHADGGGEEEHRPIERDVLQTRGRGGGDGDEAADAPRREEEAEQTADRRKQHALEEQQAYDLPAAGAERDTDRDLPRAVGRAREQQAADVRAGDQQHERHGRRQHQEHRPNVADEIVVQRDERHPGVLPLRILAAEDLRDRGHAAPAPAPAGIPGFNLPMTRSTIIPRGACSGLIRMGVKMSASTIGGRNDAGMIPTTATAWPSSRIVRPTSVGSRPNRRVHNAWPTMATGAASGRSSSSEKTRPSIGGDAERGEVVVRHGGAAQPLGLVGAGQVRHPSSHRRQMLEDASPGVAIRRTVPATPTRAPARRAPACPARPSPAARVRRRGAASAARPRRC